VRTRSKQTQLIEKTAKSLKLAQLLMALGSIAGIIMVVAGSSEPDGNRAVGALGVLLALGSLLGFMIVRFIVWWKHG